jgi:hypothetical protein
VSRQPHQAPTVIGVGWDDDPWVAAWPSLPPLPGDPTADACVVGLGTSGLAAAAAFADRGLRVIGVDAGRVAADAAGRNGGLLLGGGALYLHQAVAIWGEQPAVELYRATLAELDRLIEIAPDAVRRCGSLRLADLPGPPQDDDEAADRAAELPDCGTMRPLCERMALPSKSTRASSGEACSCRMTGLRIPLIGPCDRRPGSLAGPRCTSTLPSSPFSPAGSPLRTAWSVLAW